MNLHHLQAFFWLRWRIRVNQVKRGGIANAIILVMLCVSLALMSVGLFFTFLAIGSLAMRRAEPPIFLYVWDGLIVGFLFCWCIGLLTELQRAEVLWLDKFLHLPVSVKGAFFINYLSALFSVTLMMFLPAIWRGSRRLRKKWAGICSSIWRCVGRACGSGGGGMTELWRGRCTMKR